MNLSNALRDPRCYQVAVLSSLLGFGLVGQIRHVRLAATTEQHDFAAVVERVVPETAIVPERSRRFVFVVGPDDIVERREVNTGRRKPGLVEVTGGLSAGEIVVVEGTQKAIPGRAVRVIERAPLPQSLTAAAP